MTLDERVPRGARIDGLDLIRGIAVGLVMLRHAFPAPFAGAGVVGVVMFFALSGYLITGLLVGELEGTGRVEFARFYARRAWRLVPALVVLVLGVASVTLTLDPPGDRGKLGKSMLVALTWTGNLPFGDASAATFHLWTLATEEQFYLLWPAVLAFAFARRRIGLILVLAGLAWLFTCTVTLFWFRDEPDLAYALPTSWAGCFVIGAATRMHRDRLVLPPWAAGAALAGLVVLSMISLRGHALTYLAGGPAIATLTAALLLSWRSWADVTTPMLRPLVWLGTCSYGAYLWNYPLTVWLRPYLDHGAGALAGAMTVLAAALSWHAVERPLQRHPRFGRHREPVSG